MILMECNGRIDAPIETVWEVVSAAERLPAWHTRVRESEVLSGEGFGRRQRVRRTDGTALDVEVISYSAPTLISWRERAQGSGARAKARTEMHVDLSVDGAGTRVRLTVVRWPVGRWQAALPALRAWWIRRELTRSLASLAEAVAAGHPVTA